MKAYPLPALLTCATCGFGMQSHGLFTGGGIVVTCTGFECPEYNVQRRYQVEAVDLVDVEPGDLVPIDLQPQKPVAVDPPVDVPEGPVVGTDPPEIPAEVLP